MVTYDTVVHIGGLSVCEAIRVTNSSSFTASRKEIGLFSSENRSLFREKRNRKAEETLPGI